MSKNDDDNALTIIIDKTTHRTNARFRDKITLEEIFASRVMKDLECEKSLKSTQMHDKRMNSTIYQIMPVGLNRKLKLF